MVVSDFLLNIINIGNRVFAQQITILFNDLITDKRESG